MPSLVIDACEWFHDPALANDLARRHWRRLPSRAADVVPRVLAQLAAAGVRATWCVPGGLAQAQPELVRSLVAAGHEVAAAWAEPRDLGAVPVAERALVLAAGERARAAVEAASGQRVSGCRDAWPATGQPWWREPLAAAGYDYDATAVGAATGAVRLRGDGLATAPVAAFALWQLDDQRPAPVGLPQALVRAQFAFAELQRATFAALLREAAASPGTWQPLADAFAVPAEPAPPRAPVAATPPLASAAPRLAIVVPLKDEALGVPSLVDELAHVARELADVAACEFVFVDDGSTDRTAALLDERLAALPAARLVRHARNQGVAAAIHTGIRATDAERVASIDGDLSYDPLELRAMLRLLDGADVVTASPYHPQGGVRHVPGWRLVLSKTLSCAYRLLLHSDVRTWTSCCRVYRRAAVAELPVEYPGFLGTAELLVRVLRRGGKVREHPCVLEARMIGVSKMKVLRTIRGHLGLLWRVVWRRVG